MTTLEKTKIFRCLQCPVFRNSLSDYIISFYPYWVEYKEKKESFSEISDFDDCKEVLKTIVDDLHIKCDVEFDTVNKKDIPLYELMQALGKLIQKNQTTSVLLFPKTYDCAKTLNHILPLLITCLKPADYPVQHFAYEYRYIFSLMESLVCGRSVDLKSIQNSMSSYSEHKFNPGKIIEDYCSFQYEISFKYCNPELEEFTQYEELSDCRKTENQSDASNLNDQSTFDIDELNDQSRKILYAYLMSVPKQFGANLSRIMQLHGITENDLAHIMDKDVNRIQALCKCKTNNQSPEEIRKLARALLVSEDVLYSGSGILYGNWKELLNEYEYKDTAVTLGVRNKSKAKESIRDIIKQLIGLGENEFIQMLEHSFFRITPCCLYLKDRDNFIQMLDHRLFHAEPYGLTWKESEDSYDYDAMYKAALHPEYIDILISALRKNQPNV